MLQIITLLLILAAATASADQSPAEGVDWLLEDALEEEYIPLSRPSIIMPEEVQQALQLYEAKEYRRAAQTLERFRHLALPDGNLDFICFILAETYRMLGLRDRAQDNYEYVIARFPRSAKVAPSYFRLMQYAYEDRNADLADSVKAIFKARYLNHPLYPSVLYISGKLCFRNRQYAEAMQILSQIPRNSSRHLQAQLLTALCHLQERAWDKAALLLDYVRRNTLDEALLAEVNILLGDVYYSRDTLQTAFRYYVTVPKTARRYPYAVVKMGWVYMAQKQYGKARQLVENYLQRNASGEHFFEMMSLLEQACEKMGDTEKEAKVSGAVYRYVTFSRLRFDLYSELGKVQDMQAAWKNIMHEALRRNDRNSIDLAQTNVRKLKSLEDRMFAFLGDIATDRPRTRDQEMASLEVRRYLKYLKDRQGPLEDTMLVVQRKLDTALVTARVKGLSDDSATASAIARTTSRRDSLKVRLTSVEQEQATIRKECIGGKTTEDETPVKYIDWAFIKYLNKKAELAEASRKSTRKKSSVSDTVASARDSLGKNGPIAATAAVVNREKLRDEIALTRRQLIGNIGTMLDFYPRSRYNPQILFRLSELYFDESADSFDIKLREYERKMAEAKDSADMVFPEYDLRKTLGVYDRIIAEYPKSDLTDQAYFYKALSLQKIGMVDSANTVLQQLVAHFPESKFFVEANMNVGRYFFEHPSVQGKTGYKLAENAFREVLYYRDHPQFVQALYNLGWCYYMQDQYEEAIAVFKYLVEEVQLDFDPTKVDEQQIVNPLLRGEAIDYIAISFDEEGRVEEAIKFLDLVGNGDYAAMVLKRIGELREEIQDFNVALTIYQRLLTQYPQSTVAPDATASLIKIYDSMNMPEKAMEAREAYFGRYARGSAWQKAVADRDPTIIPNVDSLAITNGLYVGDEMYRRAETDRKKEDYDRAVKNYTAVVTAYPDNPRALAARWNLALILDQKLLKSDVAYTEYVNYSKMKNADASKREQAALNAIAIAQRDMPADSSVQEGKLEPGAVKVLEASANYIDQFPNGKSLSDVLFSMGALYFNRKMFSNAVKIYTRIIEKFPQTEDYYKAFFLTGQCYFGGENWTEASTAFELVWQKGSSPQKEEARKLLLQSEYMHAKQILASSDFKSAARAFTGIEDRFPQSEYGDVVLFNAAESYEKIDSLAAACAAYHRLAKSYPLSKLTPGALFNAAADYEKLNDYEKAAETYETLIAANSSSDKAKDGLFNLGFCYEKLNKPDKMAEANERYTTLYPGEKDARAMMLRSAQFYFKAKMYDKARNVYGNFLRRFPDDIKTVEAWFNLGKICMEEGSRKDALVNFAQAEKQNEQFALAKKETDNYSAGEAAYFTGEIQQDVFAALKFGTPGKKMKEDQQAKTELMTQAAKAYTRALQYQSERMFEAGYRIGQMYEQFTADWLNQKTEETDPIKTAVFQKEINQIASALQQKAFAPFKKMIELSKDFDSLGTEQKKWISLSRESLAKDMIGAGGLLAKAVDAMYGAPIPKEIQKKPLHYFQYMKQLNETMDAAKGQVRDYFLLALKDLRSFGIDTEQVTICKDRFGQANYRMGSDYERLTEKILKNEYDKPDNMTDDEKEDLNFQLEDITFELQDKAIFAYEDAKSRAENQGETQSPWYKKIMQSLAKLSPETYGKSFYAGISVCTDTTWSLRPDSMQGWNGKQAPAGGWKNASGVAAAPPVALPAGSPKAVWAPEAPAARLYFRKDFFLNGFPRNASIYFSVSGKFKLYLNGVFTVGDTVGTHVLGQVDSMSNIQSLVAGGDNSISLASEPVNGSGGIAVVFSAMIDTSQHFESALKLQPVPILSTESPTSAQPQGKTGSPKQANAAAQTGQAGANQPDTTKASPASSPRPQTAANATQKSGERKKAPAYVSQYRSHGELIKAIDDYGKRAQNTELDIKRERVALQKLALQQESLDGKIRGVMAEIDSIKKAMEEKTRTK
jgi:tetratricopeptide (TPR) repeat protein